MADRKAKQLANSKLQLAEQKPQSTQRVASRESQVSAEYTAAQITVLSGLDPVRKRPGMYIGGTGSEGLHHLVWEVLDNSIDEAMGGFADDILLELLPGSRVAVTDNGRGIPVDKHPQTGTSALEVVMTTLHAGGKFGTGGYKVSGGLHGVGVSVVNALSLYLKAEVFRDGKTHEQEYVRGKASRPVKSSSGAVLPHGTRVEFEPDPNVFKDRTFNRETILDHIRQQAYLTKKTKITLIDRRDQESFTYTFYFEGGIASFVRHLSHGKTALNDPFYVEQEKDGTLVEVSLSYLDDFNEHVYTFANNIYTTEGGTHLTGFRTALTRAINNYAKKIGVVKGNGNGSEESLTGEDVREGLVAIVSVKLREPQFEGQTKAKLGNPEVRTIVDTVLGQSLETYFEEHPTEGRRIIEKCLLSARARIAARAARETVLRKGALEGMTLPGKLADCTEKRPDKSELFIVEGPSAGGSAKQGRDRSFQAILPLRGKILNVERARIDRMLTSEEIKNLVVAMGAGITDSYNPEKIRYHRIIIMTDADVDGAHIRTLLLTLFYRYFQDVIFRGYLYIAQPPLFAIVAGKEKYFAYADEEKEQLLKTLKPPYTVQRFKGLGEMNAEQLWETTMSPNNRILKKVSIEDAAKADEIFSILMGDEVGPRKRFIQTHAKAVKNLDI